MRADLERSIQLIGFRTGAVQRVRPNSGTSSVNSPPSRRVARLVAETVTAPTASGSARAPAAMEQSQYLAGEVIGDRYRLVRELGRGGMGVVWVAHSLVLGVDVALKLIRASVAGPALTTRMAREAHAAARLGHPALVRVFDFGWTGRGDPFLVMELVQGETLSALLARDLRMAAIRAVQMLLPLADGLRVAHEKSIVHRDIKPDNIFIATDAFGRVQPKLLDFGIAKVDRGPQDGKLTQVGAVLGSPEYMSPEQALGEEDVDERTDVWSLCVVLYQMLTGTIPFNKPNYNALMQAIIHDEPVPTTEHASADRALWLVLRRGLEKDRDQRWATVTELGEALALWLYEHGIKEDICGNSIRAVWLDAGLAGVRLDVTSSAPPAGTETLPQNLARAESPASTGRKQSWPTHAAGLTRARLRPNQAILVALAIGGGVGGILAALALRPSSEPQNTPIADVAKSALTSPAGSPRAPTAPPGETEAPLPQVASPEVSAAPAVAPKASAGKPIAPRALPKPTPRTSRRSYDFGF